MKKVLGIINCLIFGFAAAFNLFSCASSSIADGESNYVIKKNYIGWIDTSNKNISTEIGNIKLEAITKLGTFNIGTKDKNGNYIPVIWNGNEFSSSCFYLKVNDDIYKLINGPKIKTYAHRYENGMQIIYSVEKVADVVVDFMCLSSSAGIPEDLLKITAVIRNKGVKRSDFGLKLVLDTVLGESGREHFYDCEDYAVKKEVLFRDFTNERWFLSENNSAKLQFIIKGGDITVPEIVVLGNYNTVNESNWIPEIPLNSTFNNLLAYNNSAAAIIWPDIRIGVEGARTRTFYMAFSSSNKMPEGSRYIALLDDEILQETKEEEAERLFEQQLLAEEKRKADAYAEQKRQQALAEEKARFEAEARKAEQPAVVKITANAETEKTLTTSGSRTSRTAAAKTADTNPVVTIPSSPLVISSSSIEEIKKTPEVEKITENPVAPVQTITSVPETVIPAPAQKIPAFTIEEQSSPAAAKAFILPEESIPTAVKASVPAPVEDQSKSDGKKSYTADYIDALLERIEVLEKDPGQANSYELELLNQELDAILSTLM